MEDAEFESLIRSLKQSSDDVAEAIGRVPLGRWSEVIHTGDGAWTRRQLLSHMAANDLRQLVRIRIGAGIPEPGDDLAHAAELETHDWNRARVMERTGNPIDSLVAEMHQNRVALVQLLRSLDRAQRSRMMPFRGEPTPLEQMVPILLGHLESHAAELTRDL
ncbi:MAG: DinB family protein [bacterium]